MESKTLNGELGDVFFPELVHLARTKRATGLLRVKVDNVIKAIFFEGGLPVFAISNLKNEQLEHFLVSSGAVSELMLGEPGLEHGKRMAASLVETGILPKAEVIRVVNELVLSIIYSMFEWETGIYSFDEKARADHDIKLKLPPGDIILEGVRRIKNPEYFNRALANGEAKLSPPSSQDVIYQGLNLKTTEAYILSRIDQPISAKDLVQLAGLSETETLRAAYGLAAAGMINLSRPDRKKGSAPSAAARVSAESDKENDEIAKLKAEVLRATHVFQAEDFYEVMGISRSADQNEIKKTYYALAKRFHPDRSHTLGDASLREKMEKIFQKISEAYETLANEDSRRSYDERIGNTGASKAAPKATNVQPPPFVQTNNNVANGNGNAPKKNPFEPAPTTSAPKPLFQPSPASPKVEPPVKTPPLSTEPSKPAPPATAATNKPTVTVGTPVAANVPAISSTERAELLAKRAAEAFHKNDLLGAVEMMRQAVTLNPDDINSRLQLIKILMRNQRWHKEVEQHYLMLIQKEPYNEKFHHMLGNYYKQTNQPAKAQATFKNLLELNPSHLAALRELQPEDDKSKGKQSKGILSGDVGSVFSKLFKR
ncbi:MAG TPA: DnaJ domain-containing protein [Blastocatellia bacterium]|nr:DnaJ domain-containing protein [Blastocatellia bacterium]